jgi:hypothetical protein
MNVLFYKTGSRMLFFLFLLLAGSCSKLNENPQDKNPNENPGPDPDALLETLLFARATRVTGTVPAVANTSLLKTNTRDTIYALTGFKIPIRVSHPETISLKGIYVALQQGTFYYDVPIELEEESDTVSVIFLEVDPGDTQQEYTLPVELIPYDVSNTPVDKIGRIIKIEPPSGNGCDILVQRPATLGDTSGIWSPEWFWFATMVFNPNGEVTFLNAPGNAFITQTTYQGCCDPNRPQGKCHPLSTTLNATANARIAYTIESETFAFFTGGTFVRQTHERKQNFNPQTTDWCAGTAGYTLADDVVTYFGRHDYVPGNKNISYGTTHASCDLCGYGSRGGALTHSCHMLVITRGAEFSKEVRIYVRNPVSEWYE